MSVHDAQPGDIYKDAEGRVWKVLSICEEKTVNVREMTDYPSAHHPMLCGGVGGQMWHGFKKIA